MCCVREYVLAFQGWLILANEARLKWRLGDGDSSPSSMSVRGIKIRDTRVHGGHV